MTTANSADQLLQALLPTWYQLLQQWSLDGRLSAAAQEALLLSGESEPLTALSDQWAAGDFSGLPPIVLLPASSMPTAAGAYADSTGTIYLNEDWLQSASQGQVLAVLTEELGHHLDNLLNVEDTPGDEGALFVAQLEGQVLSDAEIEVFRSKDDSGTVEVVGETVAVEMQSTPSRIASPRLVADVNPGPGSSFSNVDSSRNPVAVGGYLFFAASDGISGQELWKTDGTAEGTVQVADINSGAKGSYPNSFTVVDEKLYFLARDGISSNELWKTDGTSAGTVRVSEIPSGYDSNHIVVHDIRLFLGTINLNIASFTNPAVIANTLFFVANDGISGFELWRSDGTPEGTILVKDIFLGPNGGNPRYLTVVNDKILFRANDGIHGYELWVSDGTDGGTYMVKDINQGSGSGVDFPGQMHVIGNKVYFKAVRGSRGSGYVPEIWESDGTEAGTKQIVKIDNQDDFRLFQNTDFLGRTVDTDPQLSSVGSTLYFRGSSSEFGSELWAIETDARANTGVASFKISGFGRVGQILKAEVFSEDPQGVSPSGYRYTWQASSDGFNWLNISTEDQLLVEPELEDIFIRVNIEYTDRLGFAEQELVSLGERILEKSSNYLFDPAYSGLWTSDFWIDTLSDYDSFLEFSALVSGDLNDVYADGPSIELRLETSEPKLSKLRISDTVARPNAPESIFRANVDLDPDVDSESIFFWLTDWDGNSEYLRLSTSNDLHISPTTISNVDSYFATGFDESYTGILDFTLEWQSFSKGVEIGLGDILYVRPSLQDIVLDERDWQRDSFYTGMRLAFGDISSAGATIIGEELWGTLPAPSEFPVDAPSLFLTRDTGTVSGVTSDRRVSVSGLEANGIWQYRVSIPDGRGDWTPAEELGGEWIRGSGSSFALPADASDGLYQVEARQIDAAGNRSAISEGLSFRLDTTAPATTAAITDVTDNVGLIQGSVAAGRRTDDRTPTITGTISSALAAGETLRIFNGSTLLGSATVNNTALTWSYTPTLRATAGTTYNITARVADAAGNLGTASTARSFVLDTTAPATTAAISDVSDNVGLIQGSVASGGRTDDRTPTIRGTIDAALAAGETLRIFNGSTLLGSARVNNTAKTWSYTPTLPATAGTTYRITARVADAAGNLGTASTARSFALDTTAPSVASFSPLDGAIGVDPAANIVFNFSEAIQRGTGTIHLRVGSATGAITESFDAATSNRLSISGGRLTLNPTSNLSTNTRYFLTFPAGSLTDRAGNPYAGTTTYDFRTVNAVTGTAANDILSFTSTVDRLTGLAGADTFRLTSLSQSLLPTAASTPIDRITDLVTGLDNIDAPVVRNLAQAVNPVVLGSVSELTASGIAALLTTSRFPALTSTSSGGAATFTFADPIAGTRTFLAINDGVAGFSPSSDALLDITGFSGNLSQLQVF